MRTDSGWLVAGFGDDPLMGAAAGAASQGEGRFASPLEDVADLCCSLQIAAAEAVALQTRSTRAHAGVLAQGWLEHNIAAFVSGYMSMAGIERLIPGTRPDVDLALSVLRSARDSEGGSEGA
jgi:predicted trehalose synthase